MLKQFRDFLFRGSVLDLAVAVIIAGAFGAIITSLVNDIIMPLVGVLLGGVDLSALSITVGSAVVAYGAFLQAIVNFLIVGAILFAIIKAANRFAAKKAEVPASPPQDVVLLTEIRDLLKKQTG